MTAQQQLAELLKHDLACNTFIAENGETILELLNVLKAIPEYDPQRDRFYIRFGDGTRTREFGHRKESQCEQNILQRARLIASKLTEPK